MKSGTPRGQRWIWLLTSLFLIPACGDEPTPGPPFTLSPTSATFTASKGGPSPADQAFTLATGRWWPYGPATWTASSNQPWLTVTPTSGNLVSGENVVVTLHVTAEFHDEGWFGATSTVGAPYTDAGTWSGWGAWVGDAMLVWSGDPAVPGKFYDPVSDTWYGSTSTVDAPSSRLSPSVVWTGTEMIVWGGYTTSGGSPSAAFNTGARYNPSTDTWTPTSTVGAPSPRTAHRAVWTGTHMIVWGGDGLGYTYTNTGGIYDPATDTWLGPTSTVNAPSPRGSAAVAWTGTQMIVWGGENPGKLDTGYFYDPLTDTWAGTTTAVGAPSARSHLEGIWTGQEMIVWGGFDGSASTNTGARYNPTTDSWTDLPLAGAPEARSAHMIVWTGSTMIAWGGVNAVMHLNTGGLYHPPMTLPLSYAGQVTLQATVHGQVHPFLIPVDLNLTP